MTEYDPAEDEENPVTTLSEDECWELLRAKEFGRLAYHLAGEVHIAPINYAAHDGTLYFRTAEGSKLLGVVMNSDVAFEVDEITDETAKSVVLRGSARLLEGDEEHIVEQLPLRPWVNTPKYNIVAITANDGEMTGRSFNLTRPWKKMA